MAGMREASAAPRSAARRLAAGAVFFLIAAAASGQPPTGPPGGRPAGPLPPNRVEIAVEGPDRVVRSNGIPDHETGRFPNRGNPNAIAVQRYEFRVPADPRPAAAVTPLTLGKFGVAVNGVPFDPGAAEFWRRDRSSGWRYEALGDGLDLGLDASRGHVQPSGAYHYHGVPEALVARLTAGAKAGTRMVLVGYAGDGFPVYARWGHADAADAGSEVRPVRPSYRLKAGDRLGGGRGPGGPYDGTFVEDYEYAAGSGDLDECNGRAGVTPEYPGGIYHYFLTDDFPYIPRAFRGTPSESFRPGPPRGRPGGPPPGAGPPGRRPPRDRPPLGPP